MEGRIRQLCRAAALTKIPLLNADVDLLQEPEELMEQHQLQHVRDLLRKKPACG